MERGRTHPIFRADEWDTVTDALTLTRLTHGKRCNVVLFHLADDYQDRFTVITLRWLSRALRMCRMYCSSL